MLRTGQWMSAVLVAIVLSLGTDRARAADEKDEKIKQLEQALDKANREATQLQTRVGELTLQNVDLEMRIVKLKLELQLAEILAENRQRQEKARDELRRLQDHIDQERIDKERADRAGLSLEDWRKLPDDMKRTVPLPLAPRPKATDRVPANLRAEVTDAADDLVQLSVGIDAGLEVGAVLDLFRVEEKVERHLGTVTIMSRLNLFPKSAIATFTPARGVLLDRLKPEELPRKGDEVRPKRVPTNK